MDIIKGKVYACLKHNVSLREVSSTPPISPTPTLARRCSYVSESPMSRRYSTASESSTARRRSNASEASLSSPVQHDLEIKLRIRKSFSESAQNPNVELLTMNKMRFSTLELKGRTRQMRALKDCFVRLVTAQLVRRGSKCERGVQAPADLQQLSEVVFISGESGTGKVKR